MPILDKMQQNNQPDDDNQNGKKQPIDWDNVPTEKKERFHERPQFVTSREGRRQISIAALVERIADQFHAENTPDDSAVRAAQTRATRAKLLMPVVDYVLTVESAAPDEDTKGEIVQRAYSAIFGFGPLDTYLNDPDITTISIEGKDDLSVRYGHDDLQSTNPIFNDEDHLKTIAGRLLKSAGAALREDMPIVEAGFQSEGGRFVSLSVVAPPVTFALNLDIRLHPLDAPTLTGLVERGTLTEQAVTLLRAIIQSEHGFMVVGQPESGKTMTLSALLAELPNPEHAVAVERTGELHLPDAITRATVQWANGVGLDGISFGEQIVAQAEEETYQTIILDEVRADEPEGIAPLLAEDDPPRQVWSFRGPPDSQRLYNALAMLARRATAGQDENVVSHLFRRLPFVISMRRRAGRIELREIGEWHYPKTANAAQYRPLLTMTDGETTLHDETPAHTLPGLDESFWKAD